VKSQCGVLFLVLAALIAIGNAVAHMSCLYLGPDCFAAQLAPTQLVELAKNGAYLATIVTIFVSAIFVVWGLYALSAAGIIRRLPLLKFAIYAISILCIIRGILPLQLWLRHPESINDAHFNYGIAWLITGLLFLFGYRMLDNRRIANRTNG
jgi:hypothetical protein